jgi:hypothetical protein
LDAKDGTHLWAETYDRELSAPNIFAVQDEIAEQVVATIAGLSGVITRARFAEVKQKPTDSLDAYESALQFGIYFRGELSASELARACAALEHAVKSDPGYADAWAYLALLYLEEYRHNYSVRPDPLDRALGAARRAVALVKWRTTHLRMCISSDTNSTHSSLRLNEPSSLIPITQMSWALWATDSIRPGMSEGSPSSERR